MKVKKVVTSILAMLVAGSVIAGCGGSGGDKKSADGKLDRSKQFVTVILAIFSQLIWNPG